jgi:hypothetical protein
MCYATVSLLSLHSHIRLLHHVAINLTYKLEYDILSLIRSASLRDPLNNEVQFF